MSEAGNTQGKRAWQRVDGFSYAGKQLDKGQVFILKGLEADESILRLGHCDLLKDKARAFRCGVCGEDFTTERYREEHGSYRHPERFQGKPESADQQVEADQRELMRMQRSMAENPIRLDKSKASLAA